MQYNQISNEIRIELALSRDLRQPVSYIMKLITVKMKNLNEVSEIIEDHIIDGFAKNYTLTLEKQDVYQRVSKPSILHGLSEINVYKPYSESVIDNIRYEQFKKGGNISSLKKEQEDSLENLVVDNENLKELEETEKSDKLEQQEESEESNV